MQLNMNDFVKVKLNNRGKIIFYHQFDNLNLFVKVHGGKPIEPPTLEVDTDGYTSIQLWELMKIFGPHIGMGMPVPFENNAIVIEEASNEKNPDTV